MPEETKLNLSGGSTPFELRVGLGRHVPDRMSGRRWRRANWGSYTSFTTGSALDGPVFALSCGSQVVHSIVSNCHTPTLEHDQRHSHYAGAARNS
jgi:hypothetical protein